MSIFRTGILGSLIFALGCASAHDGKSMRPGPHVEDEGSENRTVAEQGRLIIRYSEAPREDALPRVTAKTEKGVFVKQQRGNSLWLPAGIYEITVEGREPARFQVTIVARQTTVVDAYGMPLESYPAGSPTSKSD